MTNLSFGLTIKGTQFQWFQMLKPIPKRKDVGSWVQIEREGLRAWRILVREAPRAAELMMELASRVGSHNAVIVSQKMLAAELGVHSRTIYRAIETLRERNWIEVRNVDFSGTKAYVLNNRVVWTGSRDGLRFALFSAAVILSETDQPDRDQLGRQEPLKQMPMNPGPYLVDEDGVVTERGGE